VTLDICQVFRYTGLLGLVVFVEFIFVPPVQTSLKQANGKTKGDSDEKN